MGKWIPGGDLLDGGIEIFELSNAIRSKKLTGRDPITGKLVLDMNSSELAPVYNSKEEAKRDFLETAGECGLQTSFNTAINYIKETKELTPSEKREILNNARAEEENIGFLLAAVSKKFPPNTSQYDFNPESHRGNLDEYMHVLRSLLFDPAEVAVFFPDWRHGGQVEDQAQPVELPMRSTDEMIKQKTSGGSVPKAEVWKKNVASAVHATLEVVERKQVKRNDFEGIFAKEAGEAMRVEAVEEAWRALPAKFKIKGAPKKK